MRKEAKMKLLTAAIAFLSLTVWSLGQAATPKSEARPTLDDVRTVAPALEKYRQGPLGDVWKRPGLAPRDRSIVTVAALVATGQVAQLSAHLNRAMDNGLTQAQAAEVFTHLAFYVGWPNAFSALPVAKDVFEKRPR
jgi:4-carboxymuconolactone decarboxylase